ncbi:Ger(x)C family spore germination protein [Paenibacillus solisilvae]|uniref:Ger(X)C family spore germination protein n=1 Tax=Paenibacillus solisilvae TaxID=2486751 RepID=A0ABW0W566_9BACL
MTSKSLKLAAVFMLIALSLTGCGFKDIDKRFFVVAMGIDKPTGENAKGFIVTLRLAVTSPKIEPGAAKTQIETLHATTIAEAVRLIKSHVDKELDFGHCKLYLLGEGLVKNDFNDIINWLGRRRDVQNVAYIAIGKPDAASVLNINPTTERYPGNTIFLIFGKDGTESSYIIYQYIFDFMRKVEEKGLDPVLPIMRGEKNGYVITRVGLLNKQKLVLSLNPHETEMYNQIHNAYDKSTVTANVDGVELVLSVSQITNHYRIMKSSDGDYVLKLNMLISGIFEEAPIGIYNKDWDRLEKAFKTQVSQEAKRLLIKVQQAGVDPFGFGLHYRATHAGSEKTWKDWQFIYPRLKFEVNATVKIEGTGITS